MGGDDDWFVRLAGMKKRRHEIGERFADARRGFHAKVFVVVEGFGHGERHIDLLLPRFVMKGDAAMVGLIP